MKTFHMKKMYKKVTAFILAITMIVAYIQIKAYAFDNNVSEITRNQAVSDATIQSGLGVAKNYGLFSLDATSHNDLECSVAAKYADLGADYNFSGNNTTSKYRCSKPRVKFIASILSCCWIVSSSHCYCNYFKKKKT